MRKILQNLHHFLLPPTCILCGLSSDQAIDLCQSCESALPKLIHHCDQCSRPLTTNDLCGQCLQHPPPFEKVTCCYLYEKPISNLIATIKFQGQLVYAKVLSELLLKKIIDVYSTITLPSMIIPVPLHKQRLRERGFNQASVIARPLARALKIPFNDTCCQRIKKTKAQARIPAKLRQENIKNAFRVVHTPAKHIAIVDDVITTGCTVTELCHAFEKVGVQQIDVWCCARTKEKGASLRL